MDSSIFLRNNVQDPQLRDAISNLFYATGIEKGSLDFIINHIKSRRNFYGLDTVIGFTERGDCYLNIHVLCIERNTGRVYVEPDKLIQIMEGLKECSDVEEAGI